MSSALETTSQADGACPSFQQSRFTSHSQGSCVYLSGLAMGEGALQAACKW